MKEKEIQTAYHNLIKIQNNNNNKHNMVIFYKKWKKQDEIKLTKNKMDLNNRKKKKHPSSLGLSGITCTDFTSKHQTNKHIVKQQCRTGNWWHSFFAA